MKIKILRRVHWLTSTQVLADFEMLEQGLEGLRPLQAFALRKVHRSEVSGRRRVRENLPKLGERAGNRRRFAENLFFVCAGFSLDNVQRRRAPRRYSRCQQRTASCTQPKEYVRPHHRAGPMRSRYLGSLRQGYDR